MRAYLRDNPEVRAEIEQKIRNFAKGKTEEATENVEE
jgi:hypothetical protein